MKNYKQTAALVTAFSIIFQTVSMAADSGKSGYYEYFPENNVDFSQIEYSEFDTAPFYFAVDRLNDAMTIHGNGDTVKALLDEIYTEYLKSCDSYNLAVLKADERFNDENNNAALSEFNKNSDMLDTFTDILQRLFSTEYVWVFYDIIGEDATPDEIETYIDAIPNSETLLLTQKENELVAEYNNIYGDANKAAEIFLQLLEIRKQIAESEGYDSYVAYADDNIYCRDYSAEEIEEFQNSVNEYITPYFNKAISAFYLSNMAVPKADMEQVRDKIGNVMKKIHPELKRAYDYMISNSLYSFNYSEEKNPSNAGYTVSFPYLNVPYIMLNPCGNYGDDYIDDAMTIIHEFGHFSASLHDPLNAVKYSDILYSQIIDTCEIHSQGIEALSEKYFGLLFGSGASGARYSQVFMRIAAMLDGCIFNEWERKVYSLENPTVDDLNTAAAEAMSKYYGLDVDIASAMEGWTSISHLFQSPLYYLSYAVSCAAACEIYAETGENYDGALDKYMTLSAMGESVPFKEALEGCGLESIFDSEVIKKIADNIGEKYALGYEDVSDEEWYYPYILYTSHIFAPADSSHFKPQVNITREAFVELLGKSEEYYNRMDEDEYKTVFLDVDADNPNAKYISWAYSNGIITGVSETQFNGNALITREQLSAIMYRYAEYKGFDMVFEKDAAISFKDCAEISDWAWNSVSWAVDEGIINGKGDNILDPKNNTTRAETAKIISEFIDCYN